MKRSAYLTLLAAAVLWTAPITFLEVQTRDNSQTYAHDRERSVREACEAQNTRNRNTVARIEVDIAKLPPKERRHAEATRSTTVELINALAPVENCSKVLARAGFGP